MTLSIDSHEDIELQTLLQQLVPVQRDRLNDAGYGDFLWANYAGELTTWEGKQVGEALAGLDAVEEQLMRQINKGLAHHYGLIIRGVAIPHKDGIAIGKWVSRGGAPLLVEGRVIRSSYSGWRAWLHRLRQMGLDVREVPSTEAMAVELAAAYLNDQEEHHRTLNRHIAVKPFALNPQPDVLSLMGLQGAGLGEELATALVGRIVDPTTGEVIFAGKYRTLWEVFHADPTDIAITKLRSGKRSVGPAAAERLMTALGRVE